MLLLHRLWELPLNLQIRHVAFWDEDTVVFTTPEADVWKASLSRHCRQPNRIIAGKDALKPVALQLKKDSVQPAAGDYPRLAACPNRDLIVVNTHDVVLIDCSLSRTVPHQLLSFGWGCYYPRFGYSNDGSYFAAISDYLWVWETKSWKFVAPDPRGCFDAFDWHPHRTSLLRLDLDGNLSWVDWEAAKPPLIQPLGSIKSDHDSQGGNLVIDGSGESILAASCFHGLDYWGLAPLQRTTHRDGPKGELHQLLASPDRRLVAVISDEGAHFWDLQALAPIAPLLPGIGEVAFSPSGKKFIARGPRSSNPENVLTACSPHSLWEITD